MILFDMARPAAGPVIELRSETGAARLELHGNTVALGCMPGLFQGTAL